MKEKLNEPIYTLTGTVIHGRGIGKHVGTPTANIAIEKKDFLPKTGVYVADILLSDKRYYGVTHIGTRPTLDNDSFVSIETYAVNLNCRSSSACPLFRCHMALPPKVSRFSMNFLSFWR